MSDVQAPPTDAGSPPVRRPADSPPRRDLEVVGEIAHAFFTASRPVEVYRLALDRATPLVGASFSSVFLRDAADPTLLRLECAHNWPQSAARYLGQIRIRAGRGPTGRAVAERRAIEVENVFADPMLRDWWEPAQELGFASLIALPLAGEREVAGAVTFYFGEPHRFDADERRLLSLIADQLSATSTRAHLIEELRIANQRLARQNERLGDRLRAVEESRRLKDEFLSNVSHELRTPLTSIMGYAHLIAAGQLGPVTERQAHALQKIDASAGVLLRLITDLLALSQLKLGRVDVQPAVHDAVALLRVALDEQGPLPAAPALALRLPDGPVAVVTDGEKVVRILSNLLSNAFKFTPSGRIEVEVAPDGDVVEWRVRDTGIGIPAEERDAVFDEFRQVDGSTTRLYGGTGLGLALSRRLAELLGGAVRLESEVGRGSLFTLRLPLRPARA
jgi:signal transduction histidine kinase